MGQGSLVTQATPRRSQPRALLPQVGAGVVMETPWQHSQGWRPGPPPSPVGTGHRRRRDQEPLGIMWISEWQLARKESSRRQCALPFASPYLPTNTHTHTHTHTHTLTAPVLDLSLEICWCPALTLWHMVLSSPSLRPSLSAMLIISGTVATQGSP